MGVTIEPVVSLIRQGPRHNAYGDDWARGAVLIHESPTEARIELAQGGDTPAIAAWLEVREAVRREYPKLRRVRWQRRNKGRNHRAEVTP